MKKKLLLFVTLFFLFGVYASEHEVNLTVGYKTVYFTGKPVKAISVNNQIPAPTLHFKQGDKVTINVHNQLDKETAIHWHGIILPWQMDGVLGINQNGIPPGGTFNYKFTLNQSGTYWYHAHAGLQEQQGLYGALLIDAATPSHYKYTKDYAMVLSDWSNTDPEQIHANLKKMGDYYSPNFPLQPSLVKFFKDYQKSSEDERKKLVADYKMMQQMRMSIYDISDIAYDAFLLNGQSKANPWTALVNVGDVVRLRFINAGASSTFHIKIPGTTMEMIHVNGNDIKSYTISDLTIAPGETFDVLVSIRNDKPYIIYAESLDTVGAAYGALVTSQNKIIGYEHVAPFPEPKPVTRDMMAMMMMMDNMKHSPMPKEMSPSMVMPVENPTNQHDSHMKVKHSKNTQPDGASTSIDKSMSINHPVPSKNTSMKSLTTRQANHDNSNQNMSTSSHAMHMDGMMRDNDNPMNHSVPSKKTSIKALTTTEKTHDKSNENISTSSHVMHMGDMIMDNDKPMNHKMPINIKQNKNSQVGKKKDMNASSHSMHMNSGMKKQHEMSMSNHSMGMSMPTEPTIMNDKISQSQSTYKTSAGTKYENLVSITKTNDPNKPVAGVINMELFGYMERFIWFINGVPEYDAKPIILEPGKRYRMVFTNNSMMRHPMHLHGHWFILRNGNDAYDPLLHTIEVIPGATITADIDTDASGQWIFHCHMLYHMMSGMARTFQYSTLMAITKNEVKPQNIIEHTSYQNRPIVRVDQITPIDHHLVQHPMMHEPKVWLSTLLDIGVNPLNNIQKVNYKGLYGNDYHKLELLVEDSEIKKGSLEKADVDIFYWHLFNQFWAIKGGMNYFYGPAKTPYWQPGIGVEGVSPYFIHTDIRGYLFQDSFKLDIDLSRDTQISNNFFIRLGARSILATKTNTRGEIGYGLNQMRYVVRPYYRLMPGLNIFTEFEYERNYGTYRSIQNKLGEPTTNNILTLGFSVLF